MGEVILSFPGQVLSCLWDVISGMSENPGRFAKKPGVDFSRKRKLDFENLMRLLISMGGGTTNHEILKYFDFDASAVSGSAFCQQRQKLLIGAFQYLLFEFNSRFPFGLYRGAYQLVGCDGSEFNICRNPDDPGTFHQPSGKSTRGFNMIHAVYLYDILSKRYLDCVVQPGRKKNEFRAICDLVDRFPYAGRPIFIGDRGFASYNSYAHAIEKGVFFLIRAKDINTLRLLSLEALPNHLDAQVETILSRTQSPKRRKHPELARRYRYISPEVSFDYIEPGSDGEYALSLRIVRFEVADGIFENIVTNLPAGEFSPDDIKQLYHLRWNLETSFRDLKHTIGTVNFHSKKPEYIEQEILSRIILFNFCSIVTLHVVVVKKDTKHVYQVNFAMAIKICHRLILLRERDPPLEVEALIGNYTLPIRLGRSFARLHRFRLPASFCYRFV